VGGVVVVVIVVITTFVLYGILLFAKLVEHVEAVSFVTSDIAVTLRALYQS
jgi:hypothetical protein